MRIRPYQTEQNRIEGAVITLFDVDELRRTLAESHQAAELNDGVNRILSALQTDQPLERTLLVLLAEGTAAAGAQSAAVLLRDDDGWVVRHGHNVADEVIGQSLSDEEVPQATIAAATRAPVSERSAAGSSRLLPDGFGDTATVVVPLVDGGHVFGTLLVAWKAVDATPNDAQIDFVAKIAALASLALTGRPR
jgi:GAF domain-containing protein